MFGLKQLETTKFQSSELTRQVWIYFKTSILEQTHGKQERGRRSPMKKMTGQTFCLSCFSRPIMFLLPVKPSHNSTRLPVGVRDDTTLYVFHRLRVEPRCLTKLMLKSVGSKVKTSFPLRKSLHCCFLVLFLKCEIAIQF